MSLFRRDATQSLPQFVKVALLRSLQSHFGRGVIAGMSYCCLYALVGSVGVVMLKQFLFCTSLSLTYGANNWKSDDMFWR